MSDQSRTYNFKGVVYYFEKNVTSQHEIFVSLCGKVIHVHGGKISKDEEAGTHSFRKGNNVLSKGYEGTYSRIGKTIKHD